jgi:apolipoprotein N-acyltransferase
MEVQAARPPRQWPRQVLLMLTSVVLVSAAFAPFGQFYLAWIGLVPWLFLIRGVRSPWAALWWGWFSGFVFFAANVWWLWKATIPGTIALTAYLPMGWAAAGLLLHLTGALEPSGFVLRRRATESPGREGAPGGPQAPLRIAAAVLLISTTWTGAEWLRLTVIKDFVWMPLGCSQTAWPGMCQVADALGVSGITFWVVLINALAMMLVIHRAHLRGMMSSAALVGAALASVAGYGVFRMSEPATQDGPAVMVLQSNDPHLRGGTPTVSREAKTAWHLDATRAALRTEHPDLVVWSETVAPPLNEEARRELQRTEAGRFMEATHQALSRLTAEAGVSLATGGFYVGDWTQEGAARVGKQIRSCVYQYDRRGRQSRDRYDKTELVLYSERMPFPSAPAWVRRLLMSLAASVAAQPLTPGDPDALTVFTLNAGDATGGTASAAVRSYRFVTPICLESTNPRLISRMIVGADGRKRADFLVNHSNDGWFNDLERAQHFQVVRLRSIENHVPTARSSNTGISGFIDSCGRIVAQLPARTSGTLTHRVGIDRRVTWYARHGDVFGAGCLAAAVFFAGVRIVAGVAGRRLVRGRCPVEVR